MRNHSMKVLLVSLLLAAAHASAQQETTDNVVVVVDASGSMNDRLPDHKVKMDAAKDALKRVLAKLPSGSNVGITVFSSSVQEKDGWIYPLGKLDLRKLDSAIDGITADGGTPLGQYIKIGADRLLQARKAQFGYGSFRLIVITDGEASDSELMDRYTPDVVARNITLNVIGVGMASDHALKHFANTYQSASDAKALEQAVRQVMTEVPAGREDGEDPFAIVNGAFSEDSAKGALGALASFGNHPIGEEPPKPQPAQSAAANGSQGPNASADGSGAAAGGCGCHVTGRAHTHDEPGLVSLVIGIFMMLGLAAWRRDRRRAQLLAARSGRR
jgi:uncharacterized protein YegL